MAGIVCASNDQSLHYCKFDLFMQVNIFHLEDPLHPSNWQEQYSENQRVHLSLSHRVYMFKEIVYLLMMQ